jgi:diguanylate cyclase (GGDEF)-like protein
MPDVKRGPALDLLGIASAGSIAAFVTILCVVAARYPGARTLLSVVIIGLGAGGLILFRQLRKGASDFMAREARAQYVASHDSLTQLPNKSLLIERLTQAARAKASDGREIAVLCVGLDRFDEVVEVCGMSAGDELLQEAAGRLNALCQSDYTLARLGDDMFAVVWFGATHHLALGLAEDIVQRMSEPYAAASGHAAVSVSVGVGFLTAELKDPAEALRQAQMALSGARRLGGARHSVFAPAMDRALKARKALEVELRRALAEDSMVMVYQPQVNAKGAVVGVEALIRWRREDGSELPPSTFIPLAESCGLSDAVGRIALRRAFADAKLWPSLKVAINVSAHQIRFGGVVAALTELLEETSANPKRFELEITESVLLADEDQTYETLHALRRLGFSIALDDFGTGYSSLSYLRRFPVDKIKIDRSFVAHLGKRPESGAIVKAIVDLADALDLKVIAEGVETREQVERLGQAGCHVYQGFYYSQPVSVDEIGDILAGRRLLAA